MIKAIKPPNKNDYLGMDGSGHEAVGLTAKYFIDTMIYGYATGDSEPFSQTYTPGKCSACWDLQRSIEKNASNNVYFDHGLNAIQFVQLEFVGLKPDGIATVIYEYNIPIHDRYKHDIPMEEMPAKKHGAFMKLKYYDKKWEVIDVSISIEDL